MNKDSTNRNKFDQSQVIPDEIRQKLMGHVNENWDKIILALTDLATGIWVEQNVYHKETGEIVKQRVYQKEPDTTTAQYLTNQVIGKPKEAVNIEGKVNLVMDA